jgi:hypothetical protein
VYSAATLTTLHVFSGADGSAPDARLALGTNGNFYATTAEGGVVTCSLSAALALLNTGDVEAPATHVRCFLSEEEEFDEGDDTFIAETTTKVIKVGKAGKAKLKAATNASSSGLFLLAVDGDDDVLASLQVPGP